MAQRFSARLPASSFPSCGSFRPQKQLSGLAGWLCAVGVLSRLHSGPGVPHPHGPVANMAVHKNSWPELRTLSPNQSPLSGQPQWPAQLSTPAHLLRLPSSPSSSSPAPQCQAHVPPTAFRTVRHTKNPPWQSFACENPPLPFRVPSCLGPLIIIPPSSNPRPRTCTSLAAWDVAESMI